MALVKLLAQSEAQPAIDKAKLLSVEVEPASQRMKVQLAKGYEVSGEFMVKSVAVYYISDADYDAMMQSMGNPAMAVGEMLQEAIWAKLEAMAVIDVQ